MSTNVMQGSLPQVRWSAVFAGATVAIAAHVCLGMFGAALGYGAEAHDSRAMGVLAGLWAVMTAFTASLMGAVVATRLAAGREDRSAWLHGTLVWCVALIVGAVLLTGVLTGSAMGVAYVWNGLTAAANGGRDAGPGAAIDAAAGSAATASLLGGIAALFGLGGALAGAAIGRQAVVSNSRSETVRPENRAAAETDKRRENVAYASTLMPPPSGERRDSTQDPSVWTDPAFDRRHGVQEDRRRHH